MNSKISNKGRNNIFINVLLMPLLVIVILSYLLNAQWYAYLVFPLIIIFMIIIGKCGILVNCVLKQYNFFLNWFLPSRFLANPPEFQAYTKMFKIISPILFYMGIFFLIFGAFVIFWDNIFNGGEARGWTFLSFGLVYITFSLSMNQIYDNQEFFDWLKEKIKMKNNGCRCNSYRHLKRKLFFSRGIFFIGVLIFIYGIYPIFSLILSLNLNNLPNLTMTDLSNFFESVEIVGVGFVILILGSGLEVEVIDSINKDQIKKKMNSIDIEE